MVLSRLKRTEDKDEGHTSDPVEVSGATNFEFRRRSEWPLRRVRDDENPSPAYASDPPDFGCGRKRRDDNRIGHSGTDRHQRDASPAVPRVGARLGNDRHVVNRENYWEVPNDRCHAVRQVKQVRVSSEGVPHRARLEPEWVGSG
jgi:hypothetical protein